jgi:sec-independent protein translocase protein TatA
MNTSLLFVFLGMIGPWQIAIIVIALLLLFGGKKIPELAKGIGQGMKEFKKATGDEEKDDKKEKTEEKK